MKRIAALILGLGLLGLAPFAAAPALAQEDKADPKKSGGLKEPSIIWEWANFVVLVGLLGYHDGKVWRTFFQFARGRDPQRNRRCRENQGGIGRQDLDNQ